MSTTIATWLQVGMILFFLGVFAAVALVALVAAIRGVWRLYRLPPE